ncbi:MAG: IS3 family transposase [Chitinispirillales bacterium]|nr:IS3 family transposase [Chitinispirillales bacterium]
MKENMDRYTIRKMAELLGVSRNAYYRWMRHGVSDRRERADAQVVRMIREIVTTHSRRYGSPRVREELRRTYGERVSLKRVARLIPNLSIFYVIFLSHLA